jgi:hypothetical protein
MAKKIFKLPQHNTGRVITTKSHFGSHSNMVVDHTAVSGISITLSDNEVLCQDDSGYYVTEKNRIDSCLADPNRYANENKRVNV